MSAWNAIRDAVGAERVRFLESIKHSWEAQARQLAEILRANRQSNFGRLHTFDAIRGIDDYQARIPIHRYENLRNEIEQMADGARARLCSAPIVAYEQTSGSTAAAKLIPLTTESLKSFQRALFPWLSDLLLARSGVSRGRCYWPISPAARPASFTPDGTRIGLPNDAEYFGAALAAAFSELTATPQALGAVSDIETWRYLTLRFLLDADDLSLISIWSPTFLIPLLAALTTLRDRLVEDVERGTVAAPAPGSCAPLEQYFLPRPARAREIALALAGGCPDTARIWPRLDTISCWTDAGAARFVGALREAFPHAHIQGKGLLATEGAVTIPLADFPYPVLAVNSGFFEFRDADGTPRLCEELREGESYCVLATTHGGLYRYDTGDQVLMRGWAERAPMLEFIGRGGVVSDLCGEKLSEPFVQQRLPKDSGFAMLAPMLEPTPHYLLILDAARADERFASALASSMDQSLQVNPHYRHARRLKQLGAVETLRVSAPLDRYVAFATNRRRASGGIKPAALYPRTDLAEYFAADSCVETAHDDLGTGLAENRPDVIDNRRTPL